MPRISIGCLLAIAFVVYSCKNNTKRTVADRLKGYEKMVNEQQIKMTPVSADNLQEIKIPTGISDSALPLDKIITNVKYIPLETSEHCLVGKIDQLFILKDRIIVVDKMKAEGIYIFDKSGKFIRAIAAKGKGPGEFNTIRDVCVNENAGEILLFDDYSDKVNIYTTDGRFSSYKRVSYYFREFALLKDSTFISYCKEGINEHISSIAKFNLIGSENLQRIVSKSFASSARYIKNKIENSEVLVRTGETVLYSPTFSDTVYEVSSLNQITAKYYLNMGEQNVLRHTTENTSSKEFMGLLNNSKYYHYNGKILETPGFVFLEITNRGKNGVFYSKKDKRICAGSKYNITNLPNVRFFTNPIAVSGSNFISVLNPVEIATSQKLFRSVSSDKERNSYNPVFLEMMDKISENDNPVLMFYSLRN